MRRRISLRFRASIPSPVAEKSCRESQRQSRRPASNNSPNPRPEILSESPVRVIARATVQPKDYSTGRTKIQKPRDCPARARRTSRAAFWPPTLSNRQGPKRHRRTRAIRFVPAQRAVLTQRYRSQWEHSRAYREEERGPIAAHPDPGAPQRPTEV